MKVLVVGAGGVGSSFAHIVKSRPVFEKVVMADYDLARAEKAASISDRFSAAKVDASNEAQLTELMKAEKVDIVLNACDPRFVMPVYRAALAAGINYVDMAMSLSKPHPDDPYSKTGIKLGDEQFELAPKWEEKGKLALAGCGVEPGLSDIFARYAQDNLFSEVDEFGVRDGANLVIDGYDFCPSFSIWTTIEECLNPPVIWEKGRGWFTTPAFSEPETFNFPAGVGPVECVNVEHEEVLLIPRWLDAKRVTFKYGLGDEFIGVLQTLHMIGLDKTDEVSVGGKKVSPRDVVAACLPDPAYIGDIMHGVTCAGTWVTGKGKDGNAREVYLYHAVDNDWCMKNFDSQAVVWQTAVNPVVAMELLASGAWSGAGLLGPEALPAEPFLELLNQSGAPWGLDERTPSKKA
ncbi:MAG: saccharopine dehydrogenase C-terminal domain-containing protein [Acidimicrobiales bacterium]|jgi:saccharopine dehydrogenase-like NADP-dependent oxidoreductase